MYQGSIKNLKIYLDEYNNIFNNYIPLAIVKNTITEEQLLKIIIKAIKEEIEISNDSDIYAELVEGQII